MTNSIIHNNDAQAVKALINNGYKIVSYKEYQQGFKNFTVKRDGQTYYFSRPIEAANVLL